MTRKTDDLERIGMLVEDVGCARESVNLDELKRDLDRFAESLRSDDLFARDWPMRAKAEKKEFNQLARYADGLLASFEAESLRHRNIPNDFCIIEKDKLLLQLRLLAHWASNEASSVCSFAPAQFLNALHSIIGLRLAPIYERHFKRKPAVSTNPKTEKADGPFVRFALYVLNEYAKEVRQSKITAEAVRSAWRDAKKHYRFDAATGAISIKGNPLRPRGRASPRQRGARKRG